MMRAREEVLQNNERVVCKGRNTRRWREYKDKRWRSAILNVKVSQIRNEVIKEETGGTCETVGLVNPFDNSSEHARLYISVFTVINSPVCVLLQYSILCLSAYIIGSESRGTSPQD